MSDYSYLHEVEAVSFRVEEARDLAEVVPFLLEQGFVLHDDVASLDREGPIPTWQHSSIVEVEFSYQGEEVFGFDEGIWDSVRLEYLFASLPFECAETFLKSASAFEAYLGVRPIHRDAPATIDEMRTAFQEYREELLLKTGDAPGSKSLAVLIHSTYPRR